MWKTERALQNNSNLILNVCSSLGTDCGGKNPKWVQNPEFGGNLKI